MSTTSPVKYTWSRYGPGYEVSTEGDHRFSALQAKLSDGRTIEMHYQCDQKGYDPGGTNWRLGKGKPPLHPSYDLYPGYLGLWRQWAANHLSLMEELRSHADLSGRMLCDRFATSPVNQARALAQILSETNSLL